MSINSYLTTLASELIITGSENDGIKKSIETLETRLSLYFGTGKTNIHKIQKKYPFGSYTRDTMLPRKSDDNSDVDYLVIFEDAKDYSPQTCLNWLKDFAEYWYSTSIVKQSLPTIVLELNKIKFELVPAYEESWGSIYIPSSDNWVLTQPKEFDSELLDANKDNNYMLKRAIRLIKHWNVNKNYKGFRSFELEKKLLDVLKYKYVTCSSLLEYISSSFEGIRYSSSSDYVKDRVQTAIDNISKAIEYEASKDESMAIHYMKKVFPEI